MVQTSQNPHSLENAIVFRNTDNGRDGQTDRDRQVGWAHTSISERKPREILDYIHIHTMTVYQHHGNCSILIPSPHPKNKINVELWLLIWSTHAHMHTDTQNHTHSQTVKNSLAKPDIWKHIKCHFSSSIRNLKEMQKSARWHTPSAGFRVGYGGR